MKTIARVIIATMVLLLVGSMAGTSAYARHGHGSRVGVGVWLGPGWWPGWWSPYYSPPYYPYYSEPPVVIEQQPELYVQPTPQAERPAYWYYCPDQQGYYPYVKQCPGGWMKVVPTLPRQPSSPAE